MSSQQNSDCRLTPPRSAAHAQHDQPVYTHYIKLTRTSSGFEKIRVPFPESAFTTKPDDAEHGVHVQAAIQLLSEWARIARGKGEQVGYYVETLEREI